MNLDQEYEVILGYKPTPAADYEVTVFDISGYPHYENVISNWYAFFLETSNQHGLGDLFYKSLREMIGGEYIDDSDCFVEREYQTVNGGRIDLIVYEGKSDYGEEYLNPIIIENKIYASPYNDFADYNDSIQAQGGESNKKCVVLCLAKTNSDLDGDFVEYTHQEYMNRVKDNLPGFIMNLNAKYLCLLQDFIANIEFLTNGTDVEERHKFYLENAEKIEELIKIRHETWKIIIKNSYRYVSEIDNKKLVWQRSKASEGRFTMRIDGLEGAQIFIGLMGRRYDIWLWLNDSLSKVWGAEFERNKNLVGSILDPDGRLISNLKSNGWVIEIQYPINSSDVDKLHEVIIDHIENEWLRAIEQIGI